MKLRLFALVMVLMLGVSPVLAQGGQLHTVSFDGFSFSYDTTLAANVNIVPFAGDPVDLQAPGGPQAPHTEFILYNGLPAPESSYEGAGSVRVYRTADFVGYTEHETRWQALQDLLAQRPDLAQFMVWPDNLSDVTLPLLPVLPAGQMIRAQAQYVDTAALSGIRYLTVYGQDLSPLTSDRVFYTFQGVSADGAYYVSVSVWLNTSMLSAEISADFDFDAFYADPAPYFNETIAALNAAAPEAFAPSLTLLDALVQSVGFAG